MNKRILLADDSLTIQKVVELTFMDESFDVDAVGSGDEALASLEVELPDILIADVHMPGPSGYEVCRAAKAMNPAMPVLLLVGTFETLDEDEVIACGADDNLKKPFDSQELLQLVQRMASGVRPVASAADSAPAAGFDLASASEEAGAAEPSLDEIDLADSGLGESIDLDSAGAGEPVLSGFGDEAPEEPTREAAPEALTDDGEPGDEADSTAEPITDWELSSFASTPSETETPEPASSETEGSEEPVHEEPAYEPSPLESVEPPMPEPEEAEPEGEEDAAPAVELGAVEPVGDLGTYEPEGELEAVEPEGELGAIEPKVELEATLTEPPEPSAGESSGASRLSDDDVERIARKVVEILADDTVREVAWDVIPDMAEIVIKDRIRELEAEAEVE